MGLLLACSLTFIDFHQFRFHASWCKSCQKVGVKYRQLALDVTDVYDRDNNLVKTGKVRFATVEFGANPQLCRGLNIKRLPYIHMYKGSLGKIAEFPCGPLKFPNLVEKLDHFTQLSNEELLFEKEMQDGEVLGDEIVTQLQRKANDDDNKVDALLERAEALFGKLSTSTKNSTTDSSVSP
jgi:thiol-disulfide isomerase/thioredoxin